MAISPPRTNGIANGLNGHGTERSRRLRVAVVGGGIGGLALAIGLSNQVKNGANLEVQIFEAAPQFKEIGAGVGVGPNARKALSLLGLKDDFTKLIEGTHNESDANLYFVWRFGESAKIAENGGEEKICETPCTHTGGHSTVHRAHFLDMMINHLPAGVANFNKRLASYTEDNDASNKYPIHLSFADGSAYDADVLVAADGIKSVIRPTLLRDAVPAENLKPRFTGTRVYRGLMPMQRAMAILGDRATRSTMYLGRDKHILTFPIQAGKVMNVVAFDSDRSQAKPSWDTAEWVVPSKADADVWQGWQEWSEDTRAILSELGRPDTWALHELHDLPTHTRGHVCLLGDSAAATLPHQGQGAAMAIESAYTLSCLLASPDVTPNNVETILSVYNDMRRERVTRIKTTSNELGRILEFADDSIKGDKEGLEHNLRSRYEWIWSWDGEMEVKKGLQRLHSLTL